MTDAVWSPGLEQNIGYMWVPIELSATGTRVDVMTEDGEELAAVAAACPSSTPRRKCRRRASASEQIEDLFDHEVRVVPDHHVEP